MIPASISVASETFVSNLTTLYYLPFIIPSKDPNTIHAVKKDAPFLGRMKTGYYCSEHDIKYATKRQASIDPHVLIRTRNLLLSWVLQD